MQKKQNDNKKKSKNQFPKMKRSQTITFWIVLALFVIVMFQMNKMNSDKIQEVT